MAQKYLTAFARKCQVKKKVRAIKEGRSAG
jgi:hypothetical protein